MRRVAVEILFLGVAGAVMAGLVQRVIGEPGPLTHALAFDTSIRDVQIAPGAEIALRLIRASGQTDAEATFIIRYPLTLSVSVSAGAIELTPPA
jgi:hypothetical protein